jgi:hypothetical protein
MQNILFELCQSITEVNICIKYLPQSKVHGPFYTVSCHNLKRKDMYAFKYIYRLRHDAYILPYVATGLKDQ